MLATNQQIRRPAEPVTGLLISPDGYILTSRFNLAEDTVWKHVKDGIQKKEFTLDLDKLTAFNPKDYERIKNTVKSLEVILPNGNQLPARLVAKHQPLGIVLLKVDAENLPYVNLEETCRQAGAW